MKGDRLKNVIAATLWLFLLAGGLARGQGYVPIPNYVTDPTGQAGSKFRQKLNDKLSGADTISPQVVHLQVGQLPTTVVNGQLYFADDGTPGTAPCTGGGGGSLVVGMSGQWSCQGGGGGGSVVTSGSQVLKGNGSGGVTNATPKIDFVPATSGSSIQKADSAGGLTAANAAGCTDYAPPTPSTGILKGSGVGCFATASPGSDYAVATPKGVGTPLLMADGLGGYLTATPKINYAPPTSGTTANLPIMTDGAGGFTNGSRQGNGTKFTSYAGSAPISGHYAGFDTNGNITDVGAGTSTPPGGTAGAIQYSTGTTFAGANIAAGALVKSGGTGAPVAANPNSDYLPGTGTSVAIQKGNGSGGLTNASPLTDFAPALTGTANTPLLDSGAPSHTFVNGTIQGNTTKLTSYAGSTPTAGHFAGFDSNLNITDIGTGLLPTGATGALQSNSGSNTLSAYAGSACPANQAAISTNASGVLACSAITSSYTDNSVAHTGVDINTSHQVTATHLTNPLPVNQGGTQCSATTYSTLPVTPPQGTTCPISDSNSGCTAGTPVTAGSGVTACTVTYLGTSWLPAGGATSAAAGGLTTASTGLTAVGADVRLVAPVTRAFGGLNTTTPGTGFIRDASTPTAGELSGDVTTSAGYATTVVQVEGAAIPVSANLIGTNGSKQLIAPTNLNLTELSGGSIPSGATSHEVLYPDAATHRWKTIDNNGTAQQLVKTGGDINNSDQVTTLHLSGPLGVSSGGTGLSGGTSGGIPAFTAAGTVTSSGVLGANLPILGGGAGAVPIAGTVSSTNGSTKFATVGAGSLTNGHFAGFDANGNIVDAGAGTAGLSLAGSANNLQINGTSNLAAYGGTTCTNQAMTAFSANGVATCNGITSSYLTGTTIAQTGVDINTSYQVTQTHLSAGLPVNQGGTGATVAGATAANNIGAAAKGANSDITSLTGLTTPLSSTEGGLGVAPTQYAVQVGGAPGAAMTEVSPGVAGRLFTDNGPGTNPTFQSQPADIALPVLANGEQWRAPLARTINYPARLTGSYPDATTVAPCATNPLEIDAYLLGCRTSSGITYFGSVVIDTSGNVGINTGTRPYIVASSVNSAGSNVINVPNGAGTVPGHLLVMFAHTSTAGETLTGWTLAGSRKSTAIGLYTFVFTRLVPVSPPEPSSYSFASIGFPDIRILEIANNAATATPDQVGFLDDNSTTFNPATAPATSALPGGTQDLLLGDYALGNAGSINTPPPNLQLPQPSLYQAYLGGTNYGGWSGIRPLTANSSNAQNLTYSGNFSGWVGAAVAIAPASDGGTQSCAAGKLLEVDAPPTVSGTCQINVAGHYP